MEPHTPRWHQTIIVDSLRGAVVEALGLELIACMLFTLKSPLRIQMVLPKACDATSASNVHPALRGSSAVVYMKLSTVNGFSCECSVKLTSLTQSDIGLPAMLVPASTTSCSTCCTDRRSNMALSSVGEIVVVANIAK
eukprot:6469941-Amphidinium_carterae.2